MLVSVHLLGVRVKGNVDRNWSGGEENLTVGRGECEGRKEKAEAGLEPSLQGEIGFNVAFRLGFCFFFKVGSGKKRTGWLSR